MKRWALKAKQDRSFWSSAKHHKGLSKINDIVKSSLQKCILFHRNVIKDTILNDHIAVNFDDVNGVMKTELRQKATLQVSVRKLHIYILKKDTSGVFISYDEKVLVRISDYTI